MTEESSNLKNNTTTGSVWKKRSLLIFIILLGFLFTYFMTLNFFMKIDPLVLIAPQEDKFSRDYIAIIRKGEMAKALALLSVELQTNPMKNLFEVIGILDQAGDLLGLHLCQIVNKENEKKQLVYYADFQEKSILLVMTIHPVEDSFALDGFRTYPLPMSYSEAFDLDFRGKSVLHYLFAFWGFSAFLFTFVTLIVCARSQIKRKWLWIIFILFGIGQLGIVWGTGEIQFKPLSFLVFSAGLLKVPIFSPWILWVSFPLGAILFHFFNRTKEVKSS